MPQPAAVPPTPEGLSPVAMTPPPVETVAADPPIPQVLLSALPAEVAAPVGSAPVVSVSPAPAPLPIFPADPALQSLIQQLCTSQQSVGQKFHLLYTPADDTPRVETFDTCQQLVGRIIALLGQPCFLHAFMGHYLPMTPGPLRHLRTPFGFMPLFTLPDADATPPIDGWAGASPRPEVRVVQIEAANRDSAPGELSLPAVSVDDAQVATAGDVQVIATQPPVGFPPLPANQPHPSTTVDVTPMFPPDPQPVV